MSERKRVVRRRSPKGEASGVNDKTQVERRVKKESRNCSQSVDSQATLRRAEMPTSVSESNSDTGRAPVSVAQPSVIVDHPDTVWPDLEELGLSDSLQAWRVQGLGGSDANIIFSREPERIVKLWREKRGEAAPDDLSNCLPVMLGSWTEAFNRQWFERETGDLVTQPGRRFVSAKDEWRRCTVDGLVPGRGAIWEAKHTSAFSKSEELLERYMPQLQHNMAVTGVERAIMSVIFGNARWEVFEVAADWLYQEELYIAEARFWTCVKSGERPIPIAPPPCPKAVGVREICLEGNNMWAAAATDWLQYRPAARLHAAAVSQLKELVEEDVARAFGHGVEARRSKSGAITIRELGA